MSADKNPLRSQSSEKKSTHYETLGLDPTATSDDIKKRYHELARQVHPDKRPKLEDEQRESQAQQKYEAIKRAYETLVDEDLRASYNVALSVAEEVDYGLRPVHGRPLKVSIYFGVNKWGVSRENGHEMLSFEISMICHWQDDRVRNWPDEKDLPEKLWHPEFFSSTFSNKESVRPPTIANRRENNGLLRWEAPIAPLKKNLDEDFDRLKNFPFDCVRIDSLFCLSGEKRLETTNEITLAFDWKGSDGVHIPLRFGASPRNGEYAIEGISYGLGLHSSPNNKDTSYNDALISFHLKRDPTFFIWKAIVPTVAIVCVCFLSYAMDTDDIGSRMETVIGMFLTSFAIQWTVMERLPPTPYLNNVDYSLTAALLSMSLVIVSHCIAFRISKHNEQSAFLFDIGALIFIIFQYFCFQIFIFMRIKRRGDSTGSRRPWKIGKSWFNRASKVQEGFHVPLGKSGFLEGGHRVKFDNPEEEF